MQLWDRYGNILKGGKNRYTNNKHSVTYVQIKKIPAGVSGFFINIKSFRSHFGPEVDSASNRNEYHEYFLGVKAAGT